MTSSRWRGFALLCLVIGPAAMLAQYVVTPVPGGDASVAEIVSTVGRHPTAMAWGLALDVPLVLVIPALLFAGLMAGAGTSRLAAIATALVVIPSIYAIVLIAQDALLHVAAQQADRGAAVALVHDFVGNPLIAFATYGYLLAHLFAYPLLALALRRAGVLPGAVAIGLGAWPVLEMAGYGSGVKPVAVAGYALQCAALFVCAAHLRSRPGTARVVRADTAHAVS